MSKVVIDAEDTKLLYRAGFTSEAIGQLMGVSHNIVMRTLRDTGMFIRPKHWKGGVIISGGYAYVMRHGHPMANKRGYVLRAIDEWEKANRKPFPTGKFPHHDNENPLDDRPENIIPMTRPEHAGLHMRRRHEHARQIRQDNALKDNVLNQGDRHQDGVGCQADA